MILESSSYFLAQFGPQTLQRSVNGFSSTREGGELTLGQSVPFLIKALKCKQTLKSAHWTTAWQPCMGEPKLR